MILINISNQIGAGPRNISLNFIRAAGASPDAKEFLFLTTDDPVVKEVLRTTGVRHVVVPTFKTKVLKPARFFYVQLLLIYLTLANRCQKALAFGNFFLVGRASHKGVLLHHPYLVDDSLLAYLSGIPHFLERVKRALFRWTLTRVHVVIVQSEYMKNMFQTRYPRYGGRVVVIPNPVSDNFKNLPPYTAAKRREAFAGKKQYSMLYASRFYPHKNHAFLLDLARAFAARQAPVEIVVTLDPEIPGAASFLATAAVEGLLIRNLGEVSQAKLAEAYVRADVAIFPSRAETFGNPLVEALQFALPVIVPHKDYALSVLADAGLYFEEDNVNACVEVSLGLMENLEEYAKFCEIAERHGRIFPDSRTWYQLMLGALDD